MADTLISASEVWLAVKDHLKDEEQAAIDVVNGLIDNQGHDAEEILDSELGQDKNIKNALSAYVVEEEEDDGLDTWGDEVDDGGYNDDEDDNY
jgi:hypothetical protein